MLRFEHLSSPLWVGHNACISKAVIVSSFVDPKWEKSEPQVKRRCAFKNGIYEPSACRGSLRMMYQIKCYEGLVILFSSFSSFRNVQSRNFQGTTEWDLSLPLFGWVSITSCTSVLRYKQVVFDYWLVVWLVWTGILTTITWMRLCHYQNFIPIHLKFNWSRWWITQFQTFHIQTRTSTQYNYQPPTCKFTTIFCCEYLPSISRL